MAIGPYELTVAELDEVAAADARGDFYLLYRNEPGRLILQPLETAEITIGRTQQNTVVINWDPHVSREHARLEWIDDAHWEVVDSGGSRNGTFVGTSRVDGRRRIDPGEMLTVGHTTLVLRSP